MNPEFAAEYYESASVDHWWFIGRRTLVSLLMGRLDGAAARVLDVGAGAATLFPNGSATVKVDIAVPAEVPESFVCASADALPFADGQFDVVGLFDVIEHLADPRYCLEESRRVLRERGYLLITVPAHNWLWSPHDVAVAHYRRYSKRGLENTLREAGFSADWISGFYGFLLPPAVLRAVTKRSSAMRLPSPGLNRLLSSIAGRSVRKSLRRRQVGLSIAALCTRM